MPEFGHTTLGGSEAPCFTGLVIYYTGTYRGVAGATGVSMSMGVVGDLTGADGWTKMAIYDTSLDLVGYTENIDVEPYSPAGFVTGNFVSPPLLEDKDYIFAFIQSGSFMNRFDLEANPTDFALTDGGNFPAHITRLGYIGSNMEFSIYVTYASGSGSPIGYIPLGSGFGV